MVARNDIYRADLGAPAGRRPVCILTRDAAIEVLTAVTCAPITRTVRGIRSEVELGPEHGLPERCVISDAADDPVQDAPGYPDQMTVDGFGAVLDRLTDHFG